jgi:hypothetical protein
VGALVTGAGVVGASVVGAAVVGAAVVGAAVVGAAVVGAAVVGAVVVGVTGAVEVGCGVTVVTGPTGPLGTGPVELDPDGVTSVESMGSAAPSLPQATPNEAHRDTNNDRRILDGFLMGYVG